MSENQPSFISRLLLCWVAFFRTLFDAEFAGRAFGTTALPSIEDEDNDDDSLTEPGRRSARPPELRVVPSDAALQLLGLLQREGRFVDFLQEDISGFSDAEVGAAARVVHEGCKNALNEHLTVEPIRSEAEETRVTLEAGFDAKRVRLTGNVTGQPPFTGTLTHRGWQVAQLSLPQLTEGHDASVIAPAEVEL